MNNTLIIGMISITIIIIGYLVYKHYLPVNYDKLIQEKKNIIASLNDEIELKSNILNDIKENDIEKINIKLDVLLSNNNNKNNNTSSDIVLLIFIILLATGIILYFTYKWTYYIQSNTINNLFTNILNR